MTTKYIGLSDSNIGLGISLHISHEEATSQPNGKGVHTQAPVTLPHFPLVVKLIAKLVKTSSYCRNRYEPLTAHRCCCYQFVVDYVQCEHPSGFVATSFVLSLSRCRISTNGSLFLVVMFLPLCVIKINGHLQSSKIVGHSATPPPPPPYR